MQTFTAVLALFAAVAVAAPTVVEQRQVPYAPCAGLYGSAVCCATDVLGIADLNCNSPPSGPPTSAAEFESDCSGTGLTARCCAIPLVSFTSSSIFHQETSHADNDSHSSDKVSSARPPLASTRVAPPKLFLQRTFFATT
jgi:hypothetical protein